MARPDRREAHATVAHHDCGDTVTGRRIDHLVPAHLAVVVGVHIDPARGDDCSIGIDDAARRLGNRAPNLNDEAIADADVATGSWGARPVDDAAAPDDVIEHGVLLSDAKRTPRSREPSRT